MVIHGINSIKEAVRSGVRIKKLYVSDRKDKRIQEIIDLATRYKIDIAPKDKRFFRNMKARPVQDVAAEIDFQLFPFDRLFLKERERSRLFLVLDLIEDPRNLGAIIRNAAACGVDGIVMQAHRSCRITPAVFSASAGTVAHVRISEVSNIKRALKSFREEGYQIIGSDSDGSELFWDLDFSVPTVFVIGSEGRGMRRTVRELCDFVTKIPMSKKVSSLNVSVAAGVLLYEYMRQKNRKR